jgi:hypothetical protein
MSETLSAAQRVKTHVVAYAPADLDAGTGGPHGAGRCRLEDFAAEITHRCKRVVCEHCLSGTGVLRQRATSHSAVAVQPGV